MTKPTISAYTTTRNVVSMDYPYSESIRSMLGFSDEVVVFDTSDGKDATQERLQELAATDSRIKIYHEDWDWSKPNHGILDGASKAKSRSLCKGDYLLQFDNDELIHEAHYGKMTKLVEMIDRSNIPENAVVAFPIVEFWGHAGKVRLDINFQKPRLSKNSVVITHGIPAHLRKYENGLLYAKHNTDTCDYIDPITYQPCGIVGCVEPNIYALQEAAKTNAGAASILARWMKQQFDSERPVVFHYSWFNIRRKIQQYKLFWTDFWKAMYNENRDPKNNPFFPGKTWEEVTEAEIVEMAKRLEEDTGGWIFHQPWDGSEINHITIPVSHPKLIGDWVESHH